MLWPPNHQLHDITIQANASDNSGGTVHLEVEVLSKYLDRAVDILADVLLEPAFRKDEIEKQRADTLGAPEVRLEVLAEPRAPFVGERRVK